MAYDETRTQPWDIEKVAYEGPIRSVADGTSQQTIHRFELQTNERLRLDRLELRTPTGLSDTNVNLDVYDDTGLTTIDSVPLDEISIDGGTSDYGVQILYRLTNNSGTSYDLIPIVRGSILR